MLEKIPESIGQALQGRRAGLDHILFNRIDLRQGSGRLTLTSPAFADHAPIPARYTADAEGEAPSPPLRWQNVPAGTDTLALVVEDADSPTSEPLVHAIAVDVAPTLAELAEGELSRGSDDSTVNIGRNSYLRQSWLPPDPPPGHGVHRYAFQLFALAPGKPFSAAPGRGELSTAIRERGIASGCMIGTYERSTKVKTDARQRLAHPVSDELAIVGRTAGGDEPIGVGAPAMPAGPELV